jgi:hypothetical protein
MQTKDPRVQVTSTGRDNWLLAVHEHGDWVLAAGRYPTQDAALGAVDEVVTEHFGAGNWPVQGGGEPEPCGIDGCDCHLHA